MEKQDWLEKKEQIDREDKKQSRIDYDVTAFMLKKPCATAIYKGPMRLSGRDAHHKLLTLAKDRGLYVWFCAVGERNGKQCAIGIHLIDWDSVPEPDPTRKGLTKADFKDGPIECKADEFVCHICKQRCTSSSGLTLHIKFAHKDYVGGSVPPTEEAGNGTLICPECSKQCNSASGLTLHLKTHNVLH